MGDNTSTLVASTPLGINKISSILLATLDEAVFFHELAKHILGLIPSENVLAYWVFDSMQIRCLNAIESDLIAPEGAIRHVLKTKRAYFTNNLEKDPIYADITKEKHLYPKELTLPVLLDGVLIAVIVIQNNAKGKNFTFDHVTEVLKFINEISVPIKNLKLYCAAKNLNEELLKRLEETKNEIGKSKEEIAIMDQHIIKETPIVGRSIKMKKAVEYADRAANTDVSATIRGERGTGREMFARRIHCRSKRKMAPFIVFDCDVYSRDNLRFELFGNEDPNNKKIGVCEMVNGGTLVINSVEKLSMPIQLELMQVLKNKVGIRVFSSSAYPCDMRLIAITSLDLQDVCQKGELLEDLYYNLSSVEIDVPSLKERSDDIEMLANYFLNLNKSVEQQKSFSSKAIKMLIDYRWPGNIRELQTIVERAYILSDGIVIDENHMDQCQFQKEIIEEVVVVEEEVRCNEVVFREMKLCDLEKFHICSTLEHLGGNKTKTARSLGITVKTLYNKLHSYGLSVENSTDEMAASG